MIKHTRDINVPSSVPAETASVLRKIRSDAHDELAAIRFPYRDYIINGSFKYWLDNTGLSAGTGYRYTSTLFATSVSNNTIAVTRVSNVVGQTDVPTNSPYFARIAVTDSEIATGYAILYIPLEDVRKYAGKTQTFSIWASYSSGTPSIAVEGVQGFGTGGSPSSSVGGISVKKILLSSSISRYDATISWPSISGKTIGTDSNSKAGINIWLSSGSSYNAGNDTLGHRAITVDIFKMQLIDGDTYHEIPEREEQEELSLIGRYYEKSYPINTMPGTTTAAGILCASFGDTSGKHFFSMLFRHGKRGTPSMTIYNPSTGATNLIDVMSASYSNVASVSLVAVTSVTAELYAYTFAPSAPARLYYHYVADSRY